MVQMNDVKMVYGNTEAAALNGISFTINEGEFVFLVGPSGSGKTTIIKLITGELSPTSDRSRSTALTCRALSAASCRSCAGHWASFFRFPPDRQNDGV